MSAKRKREDKDEEGTDALERKKMKQGDENDTSDDEEAPEAKAAEEDSDDTDGDSDSSDDANKCHGCSAHVGEGLGYVCRADDCARTYCQKCRNGDNMMYAECCAVLLCEEHCYPCSRSECFGASCLREGHHFVCSECDGWICEDCEEKKATCC
jgi:hypothetical protein